MKTFDYISKACTVCEKVKPLTSFHRNKDMKDGRLSRCKECVVPRDWSKYSERRKEIDLGHTDSFGKDTKFGDTWIHLHASVTDWHTSQRATH